MVHYRRGPILIGALAASSLFFGGCLVEIKKHDGDPQLPFADAEKDMEKALKDAGAKKAVPNDLHILVYEKDSHDLVRIRIPFWLLTQIDDKQADVGIPESFRDRGWANRDKIRITLSELKKMGPGVVLRVDDNDSRVMVWLK